MALFFLVVGIIGLRVAVRISWASNCTASSGWYNLQPLSTSSGWNECSVWWMWCRSSGLLCPGCCWISPWVTAGIKICSLVFHIWILRFKSATACASNVSYSFDQVHWPSQKRECLVFFDASLNKLMLPFFLLTQFLFGFCCCWLFEQYLNISVFRSGGKMSRTIRAVRSHQTGCGCRLKSGSLQPNSHLW